MSLHETCMRMKTDGIIVEMVYRMVRYYFLISFFCLTQFGCTHIITPGMVIQNPPAVQATPLVIGVYYSEELLDHECEARGHFVFNKYIFRLGPASIGLFDLLFSSLFSESLRIVSQPRSDRQNRYAYVAEVTMSDFSFCTNTWLLGNPSANITYKAIFKTSSGVKIAESTGTGSASTIEGGTLAKGIGEGAYLEAATRIAMRRAAADFLINFEKNNDIKTWLKSRNRNHGER